MTSTFDKQEIRITPESEQTFNWRNCWYPITFSQDLPRDRPYPFTLYDEAFVLFRNKNGELVCLQDLCPHRAAKLSDGQVIDGKIECLYHGWQFGSDGECLHIPQLAKDAKIPNRACVKSYQILDRKGIIWMWAGKSQTANEEKIHTIKDLDTPGLFIIDTVTDLPYDSTYLVENLLDPAHVPISHDRTELRAKREDAKPLNIEITSVSAQGIQGRYTSVIEKASKWVEAEFIAPCLVHYTLPKVFPSLVGGFALYAIPLGQSRSRILVRRYGNFFTRYFKSKPRWLEHLRQNKILEEDLPLIVSQEEYIKTSGQSLKKAYLALKTSDLLVVEYRKWLDRFGSSLPYYQGYATAKVPDNNAESHSQLATRLERHTQICSSCNRAYRVSKQVRYISIGLAIALFTLAVLVDDSGIEIGAVSIALLAVIIAASAQMLKTRFEVSYSRFPKN